jgi:hypothetical protein
MLAVGFGGGGGVYGSSPPPPPPPPPQDEIKKIITAKYEKLVNLYLCILGPKKLNIMCFFNIHTL